jgi:hypothetical protein
MVDFEIFIKLWKGSEIMRLDKAAAAARGFKLTYRVPPTQVYMSQATLAYQAALTFSPGNFEPRPQDFCVQSLLVHATVGSFMPIKNPRFSMIDSNCHLTDVSEAFLSFFLCGFSGDSTFLRSLSFTTLSHNSFKVQVIISTFPFIHRAKSDLDDVITHVRVHPLSTFGLRLRT